jgi:endonuclease YncB( thermonuclease family)
MAKTVFKICCVTLGIAGIGFGAWIYLALMPPSYGTVVTVCDGSSFVMRGENKLRPDSFGNLYRVTLVGVIPNPLDVGNGLEAKKYLESLILNQKVGVKIKDWNDGRFTNFIYADEVFVISEGIPDFNVGVRILQEGYAHYIGNSYAEAESCAKSQHKGIWKDK